MKPSAGVSVAAFSGRELEGSLEVSDSSVDFRSPVWELVLVVVFVSVAWWPDAASSEGCCVGESLDSFSS